MMECQESFIVSSYFAPRGHKRMYALGMQLAQQYLSPFPGPDEEVASLVAGCAA